MAENSKIQWCTHTFNPWRGCTKVSEGCLNCYAEAGSKRNPGVMGIWGPQGTREIAAEAQWRLPVKWNRWAANGTCHICAGHGRSLAGRGPKCEPCEGAGYGEPYRARVFCASLADVFEGRDTMPQASWEAVEGARRRLFLTIATTSHLDWLLLTKRPENILDSYRQHWAYGSDWPKPNIWLGTSVENQQRADERIPHLIQAPAAVRFLSCEPLLGPLDLEPWLGKGLGNMTDGIDWVIVGGESGHHARVFDITWAEEIVEQCRAHKVACFVKQFGARPAADGQLLQLVSRKGDDLNDWPEHLLVREFPQ